MDKITIEGWPILAKVYHEGGQIERIRTGRKEPSIELERVGNRIIANGSRAFDVVPDGEWCHKFNYKTKTIKAAGGIDGLWSFLSEATTPDDFWFGRARLVAVEIAEKGRKVS